MKKSVACFTALLLTMLVLVPAAAAAENMNVSVRIVGLGEDIYNGEVSLADGSSVGDALAAVEDVEIVGLDSYITTVNAWRPACSAAGTAGITVSTEKVPASASMITYLRTATQFCFITVCSICRFPRFRMRTAC